MQRAQSRLRTPYWLVSAALIVSVFSVISCAQRPNPAQDEPKAGPAKTVGNASDSIATVQKAAALCAGSDECLESVGLVATAGEEKPRFCTGFLIDHDIVATASSCLPADLRDTGVKCKDRIKLAFPETRDHKAETLGCSTILRSTELTQELHRISPDYAFLRLERPLTRQPLTLDESGISPREEYEVVGISSLDESSVEGQITHTHCKPVQKSILLPSYNNDSAPLAALSGSAPDCALGPQHPGAPLLDGERRVHGIIQGKYAEAEAAQKNLRQFLRKGMGQLGFATNLSCVRSPLSPERILPPECRHEGAAAIYSPGQKFITDTELERIYPEIEAMALQWQESADELFWKPQRQEKGEAFLYTPVPECILSPEKWISRYKKPWWKGGGYESADHDLEIHTWELRFSLTPSLVLEHQIVAGEPIQGNVTFSTASIHDHGMTKVKIDSSAPPRSPLIRKELKVCAKTEPQKTSSIGQAR